MPPHLIFARIPNSIAISLTADVTAVRAEMAGTNELEPDEAPLEAVLLI